MVKSCYPNALIAIDKTMGQNSVIIDFNEKVKYVIWLKKPNEFELYIGKVIWNQTFEMKAKAQEIFFRIKDFIENGHSVENLLEESTTNSSLIIPHICPVCKSPNPQKIRICEWCGNKII